MVAVILMGALSLILIYRLIKVKSLFLSIGIIFLIEILWAIFSCAYLDYNNVYIIETNQTSYHTGALFRMILLYLPFIYIVSSKRSGCVSGKYMTKMYFIKIKKEHIFFVLLLLSFFVVVYFMLDMLITGIPLFSSEITRINYSEYSTLPFAMKINGEITYFLILICGIVFFDKNEFKYKHKFLIKLFAFLILVISIVTRFLMEYKYHGMYNIIFAFFIPFILNWLVKKDYKILNLKYIAIFGCFFACLCFIMIFIYSKTIHSHNPVELLFDRLFALQSHSFWKIDDIYFNSKKFGGNSQFLRNEFLSIFNGLGQMDTKSGMFNVMFQIADKTIVLENIEMGVRFAGSYLTVGINTMGYFITFLVSFALGFMVLFVFKMFYSSLKNIELVTLFLSQSLLWDLLDYFRIGSFCIVLNVKTIFTFGILIIIYNLKKYNYNLRSVYNNAH